MAEEPGSGEEEQPPTPPPEPGIDAVGPSQYRFDPAAFAIEIGKPVERRLPVMRARPPPFMLDPIDILEPVRQVEGRHDAAREEVMRDPVGRIGMVKAVGSVA